MLGYSSTDVFSAEAKRYAFRASSIVAALPDKDGELRCHEVARAVARCLDDDLKIVEGIAGIGLASLPEAWPKGERRIYVIDGWYGMPGGPRIDHSWLLMKPVEDGMVVLLDPYAVGRLPMVQLIDTQMELAGMYQPCREPPWRLDINREKVDDLIAIVRSLGLG